MINPSPDEHVRAVAAEVLAEAAENGRRPSVLAVAKLAGLSNTTFRRRHPDLAHHISQARRTPTDTTAENNSTQSLAAKNADLSRANTELRQQLRLAAASIQRLTIQNEQLRSQLEVAHDIPTIPRQHH